MFKDLQLACRRLRQAPAFTVIAVLTLALAIGANTAIFGIADTVLFRQWINASRPYRTPRFQTLVLTTFAMLAIVLTALGMFAVVSFAVAARRLEMGVRLAIGASPVLSFS